MASRYGQGERRSLAVSNENSVGGRKAMIDLSRLDDFDDSCDSCVDSCRWSEIDEFFSSQGLRGPPSEAGLNRVRCSRDHRDDRKVERHECRELRLRCSVSMQRHNQPLGAMSCGVHNRPRRAAPQAGQLHAATLASCLRFFDDTSSRSMKFWSSSRKVFSVDFNLMANIGPMTFPTAFVSI